MILFGNSNLWASNISDSSELSFNNLHQKQRQRLKQIHDQKAVKQFLLQRRSLLQSTKIKRVKISLSIQVSDEITDLAPIRSRVKVICEEPISAYSSRQFDRIASKEPPSYYEACAPLK